MAGCARVKVVAIDVLRHIRGIGELNYGVAHEGGYVDAPACLRCLTHHGRRDAFQVEPLRPQDEDNPVRNGVWQRKLRKERPLRPLFPRDVI
jgi:hypothetical protein